MWFSWILLWVSCQSFDIRLRASSPSNPRLTLNFVSDSLQYLPLADATTLNLLAPLGASLVTTKRLTLIQIGSIAICFLGVGLITKPSFITDLLYYNDGHNPKKTLNPQSRLGLACAMIGVLGGVVRLTYQFFPRIPLTSAFQCAYSSISKIGTRSHPLVTTNCFATGILIVSSVCFAAAPGVNFNFNLGLLQWFIMGCIGLFGAFMVIQHPSNIN